MQKVYIKDKNDNKVLPITSTKAVEDENGNSVDSILGDLDDRKENISNKVTSISGQSTNTEYPSAMAVYNALVGRHDILDLSLYDCFGIRSLLRNTANSYIVRAVGSYRIPLVYGNGIKNGMSNTSAFTRQGTTYTAEFVNHLGNTITSPYIEENTGCTANNAGLLWQTTAGIINNIFIFEGGDCNYIQFDALSIPDTNALAVLYITDENDNIMWSWTIWLTREVQPNIVLTNYTEVEYEMMGLPFGAIWDSNKTHYVVPHYQWGRKDPMVPSTAYNSSTSMTVYDINGNVYSGFGNYGVADDSDEGGTVRSVANAIRMPNKFFIEYDNTSYNWNNLTWFNNFWNAAETTSSSLADNQDIAIKTIYDPSPVGYMLPSGRFATGFTTTGSNTDDSSKFNVIGSWANGWTFKKNSDDTTGIFFPAAGYRYRASGALSGMGGRWWSFAPGSRAGARSLYVYSSGVYPLNYNYRAYGFGVWAALELY